MLLIFGGTGNLAQKAVRDSGGLESADSLNLSDFDKFQPSVDSARAGARARAEGGAMQPPQALIAMNMKLEENF